jgi:rare lipoprotein A (peptidoglycan hydrolase)
MAFTRRMSITAALVAAVLGVVPWSAHAEPKPLTSADLPRLTQELTAATARAQALTEQLNLAAAQDGGLRVAYARLEDTRYAAQAALDTKARQVYMASAPAPVGNWEADLAAPELQELAHRGQRAALTVGRDLVDAVTAEAAQLAHVQRQADAFRMQLLVQAQAVLAEQDRARELYVQAKTIADAEHAAQVQALLEQQRALLDGVSTAVTLVLTPAQSRRARLALENQAPVIALLERTGAGIPDGYAVSGTSFAGTASWYGPGFVGRPTASGAPYDPERLTCAHKTLPLGTVVHVSANGFAINCLVNDRGPYVGDRVLDMSRAGSRALGYSGLAQVVVEVLVPV